MSPPCSRLRADWVAQQARVVLADMPVGAFKIGMVATRENAAAIAAVIDEHPAIPVVLDPVLASGRGDPLGTGDVATALVELLVPRATVVTPNSLEARRLAAAPGERTDALPLERCAERLTARGAKFVLVTGTHEPTREVVNALYDARGLVRSDRWERLPGEYHGSGCTLAAAIAAGLAHGLAVPEAVQAAQGFTWQTLADAFRPGAGQAIPDRLFRLRAAAAASRRRVMATFPAGLYALTPDEPDTARARRQGARRDRRRRGGRPVPQQAGARPRCAHEQARALAAICRAAGVPLMVNDDVELALAVDAAGVHLGRDDGDLAAARRRLGPGRLLGASCYDRFELAERAVAAGADHVAFGSMFASPTKPAAVRAPLALLGAARQLGVPIVAIGGITLENAPLAIAAGADAIAVITALFDAGDVAARARAFTDLFTRKAAA